MESGELSKTIRIFLRLGYEKVTKLSYWRNMTGVFLFFLRIFKAGKIKLRVQIMLFMENWNYF